MYHFAEMRTSYLTLCERPNFGRIYTILGIYTGYLYTLFVNINSSLQYKFVRNLVFHRGLDVLFGFPQSDTYLSLTFIFYSRHV